MAAPKNDEVSRRRESSAPNQVHATHTPVLATASMPAPPALRCACGKTFPHHGGTRAENALLRHQKTCAAPDLLEVVERYVNSQDFCVIGGNSDPETCECTPCDLTRAARAAIAKAGR